MCAGVRTLCCASLCTLGPSSSQSTNSDTEETCNIHKAMFYKTKTRGKRRETIPSLVATLRDRDQISVVSGVTWECCGLPF